MDNELRKAFWYALAVSFAIKCLLALAIPLTSDEAYFFVWAKHLDFGYYDHPPMVAWIMRLFMVFGSSPLALRMPAILSTLAIGAGIYLALSRFDRGKAFLAAVLFLVSPLNILYVPVSTDTPVIFFAFLSAFFFHKAEEGGRYPHYLLSGLFLGCAFLSKYFAALLGFSYLIYYLVSPKDKRKTAGLALVFAAVVPFVLLNLYWNYTHSWANIMFNVFNRNRQETFSLGKAAVFLLSQAWLMTPGIAYYAVKKNAGAWKAAERSAAGRYFGFLYVLPMLIFLALSFKKVIGLHWALSFYPFLFIAAFFFLSTDELAKSVKAALVFSFIHLFLIGALLTLPLDTFAKNKNFNMIVMGMRPSAVVEQLKPYEKDFNFATESYAESAVIGYHYGRYFMVFGGGSQHGRQDDMITDFRALDGANILILRKAPPPKGEYDVYFRKVVLRQFEVDKATFCAVLGYGFRYAPYRDVVLTGIKNDFYNIPPYLPVKRDYFGEKYFRAAP